MISSFKLENLLFPRKAARESNAVHYGLCPRIYDSHHFHRGNYASDEAGKFNFHLSRLAEDRASAQCVLNSLSYLLLCVTVQYGSVTHAVLNKFFPLHASNLL